MELQGQLIWERRIWEKKLTRDLKEVKGPVHRHREKNTLGRATGSCGRRGPDCHIWWRPGCGHDWGRGSCVGEGQMRPGRERHQPLGGPVGPREDSGCEHRGPRGCGTLCVRRVSVALCGRHSPSDMAGNTNPAGRLLPCPFVPY